MTDSSLRSGGIDSDLRSDGKRSGSKTRINGKGLLEKENGDSGPSTEQRQHK